MMETQVGPSPVSVQVEDVFEHPDGPNRHLFHELSQKAQGAVGMPDLDAFSDPLVGEPALAFGQAEELAPSCYLLAQEKQVEIGGIEKNERRYGLSRADQLLRHFVHGHGPIAKTAQMVGALRLDGTDHFHIVGSYEDVSKKVLGVSRAMPDM